MDELSVEQVANLREWVRNAVKQGYPKSLIDASLNAKHPGVTSSDVMKMSGEDFARSMAQGITMNQAPKIAGALAALKGGDYAKARDLFQKQDDEASAANPGLNLAVKSVAGAVPGVATALIPGMQPVEGATLLNAGKAMLAAGGVGGVSSEGASKETTAGGIAKDTAKGAGIAAALGGFMGAAGNKVADWMAGRGLPGPGGVSGAVLKEGGALMPNSPPDELRQVIARQEMMAPGTVVGADLSPGLQKMASGVGADRATAMKAAAEAEGRHQALNVARKTVGAGYDVLRGQTAPLDPQIEGAIAAIGKKVPVKGREVDLGDIHDLRSDLLKKAGIIGDRDPGAAYELRQQATPLTDWLQQKWPAIKSFDSDYAFISDRIEKAEETMKYIKNSQTNYGVQRAYGQEPSSIGGSLPGVPLPGGTAGTVVRTVAGALSGGSRKAAAAQAVYKQFLTPVRGTDLAENLIAMHNALQQPIDHSMLNAGLAAVIRGSVPTAAANVATGNRGTQ